MDEHQQESADAAWADDTTVRLPDHALVLEVDDEAVVLNTNSETYFQVNDVGALLLRHMGDGSTVRELVDVVVGEYDVDRPTVANDLAELLDDLRARGLITSV